MSYKILSLDGGGSWALIQARVLEQRYGSDIQGHEILKKFDMAIANSGGSLVLALLCANKTPRQIIAIFNNVKVLQSIFKKKWQHYIPKLKDFAPNYETENKYGVFRQYLYNQDSDIAYGDTLLIDLPSLIGKPGLELIITTFDYDRERAVYFRSNPNSHMETSWIQGQVYPNAPKDNFKTVTLAKAVHAASNAPVHFFDDPASFTITTIDQNGTRIPSSKHRLYWDGAVGGNNNPIKSGVLEAIANNHDSSHIQFVSIGTSNTICPVIYGEVGEAEPDYEFLCRRSTIDGWIGDLRRMASSILSDPPDASTFEAHQILRGPYVSNNPKMIRINPLVKPIRDGNRWTLPGDYTKWTVQDMETLFGLDMAVATEEGIQLINQLCDDFFDGKFDNQGIRIGGSNMDAILGHKLFSDALADWNNGNYWP